MPELDLLDAQARRESVPLTKLVVAGWTGRDPAAVAHHIEELKAIGVTPPSRTPIFYLASLSRVTCAGAIEVLSADTSGEAEFVLLQHKGALWVGIGSDHTDRKLETYGVAASKQICDKPIGTEFWRYDAVAPHWDQLKLRAYATIGGKRELYQDGSVAQMLAPSSLLSLYNEGGALRDGTLMFCGTLAAIGGIRPAERFECELIDPVLQRTIRCGYDINVLPVVS
ncbi:DUF2848 domain-containing protein [Pseudorhodoplanes sp.]|uniref:DUF2848 domain-containing protein n=1 Tax=Pseudorhodoplanes sp. TaxID=1934341 RepID=UPI002C075ABF|nr:DUF2848 domain-containing protein [Pseudorhodoplanes sp.]HWV42390.1 DUF2848 domain-containing protein [Pseudorhodoplanes sp.]